MVAGSVVARNGTASFEVDDDVPEWTRDSIRLPETLDADLLRVSADGPRARVRAMEMYNGYFKRAFDAELAVEGDRVQCDTGTDVLKIAVIDRHHAEPLAGVGFVRGFGLRRGAIAISMNCPNMNIAVVGADDASMLRAVEEIRAMGGGFVTVDGDEVLARVELPVGGMMSDAPFEETAAALAHAHAVTADLGCPIPSPYIILSFVGLYVVPDLGVTERGLVDTRTQQFVDVLLPGPVDACGHADLAHP